MSKLRVNDLAGEFGISAEEVVTILRQMDIPVRSHISELTDDQVARMRARWEREKRARAEKPAAPAARRRRGAAGGTATVEAPPAPPKVSSSPSTKVPPRATAAEDAVAAESSRRRRRPAAEVAAASAAADSPASRARLCCTAWTFEIFFSKATRSVD
ncbi:MAG: hypothetical protein NVS9B3_12100 [Gemmatimonadaceae bacterium]